MRMSSASSLSTMTGQSSPSAGGVRARARGMIQKAGEWPCKLASVSAAGVQGSKKHDDKAEGMEMLQRQNGQFVHKGPGPSPTSVADMTAWDLVPRSALCLDSVAAALQGSTTSAYLADGAGERCVSGMAGRKGYGGGVFASIRGAHNTWQQNSENDASNTRQKHAMSMALVKNRGQSNEADGASVSGSTPRAEGRESCAASKQTAASESIGNESIMGLLMRSLHDDKHTSATFSHMTRSPPAGYTGVRASAFALVSSNAVAAGRPAPERHAEAPPRVPLHHPSTKEGVVGMSRASTAGQFRCADVSGGASVLTARRAEAALPTRKPEAGNAEW